MKKNKGKNLYPRTEDKKHRLGYTGEIRETERYLERIARIISGTGEYRCLSHIEAFCLADDLNRNLKEQYKMFRLFSSENTKNLTYDSEWGHYIAVRNSIGWKVIFEFPPEKEDYKGFELEKRDVKTSGFETELIDKETGAYNWDAVRKMADQSLLDQRIGEGACEGADKVGGPCEESYRNLLKRLGQDRFVQQKESNDEDSSEEPYIVSSEKQTRIFDSEKGKPPLLRIDRKKHHGKPEDHLQYGESLYTGRHGKEAYDVLGEIIKKGRIRFPKEEEDKEDEKKL